MAKIYRVIKIKPNQFKENVHMIPDLPTKWYHGGKHFSESYLQDGGKNQLA